MKKLYLSVIALVAMSYLTYAQTNTFPTTGNVGIGTTSPSSLLTVNGPIELTNLNVPPSGPGIYQGLNYVQVKSGTSGFTVNNNANTVSNLVVLDNGNVGIGTIIPNEKLTVSGNIQLGGTVPYLALLDGTWGTKAYIQAGVDPVGNTVGNYLSFENPSGKGFSFSQGSVSKMVIEPSSGNVGVGTINPISLFQVDDGCTKASIGDASGIGLNYGTSYLGFNASRSGTSWLTNSDGGNNGGGTIYSSVFGDMYFSIIPSTVNASGQTLSDAQIKNNIALRIDHTNGAVYAKQVYVQTTGWPDYVFKKDYALIPLSDVKTYIDQNQHLPEMPSEQEVADKGINLGEMNKLLTKKIEELTLYLIEKDNKDKEKEARLQSQDDAIKQLQAANKSLEDRFNKLASQLTKQ